MRRYYKYKFLIAFATCVIASADAYDASSCPQPYRNGRADAAAVPPCDLSKDNYCNTPGPNYPWKAVRRFVHDNQGLMKRMYGDQRHGRVMRQELEQNERGEEIETNQYVDEIVRARLMYSKSNSFEGKPHFRPIQSTTQTSVEKNETDIKNATKLENTTTEHQNKSTNDRKDEENNVAEVESNDSVDIDDEAFLYKSSILYKDGANLESIANVEINHLDPTTLSFEAMLRQSIESNNLVPENSPEFQQESPDLNIHVDTLEVKANSTKNSTDSSTTTIGTIDTKNNKTTLTPQTSADTKVPIKIDTSTLPPTLLFSEHEKKDKLDKVESHKKEPMKEEFHPRPHQESVRPTVIQLRGVNACGTKEEVVAPFWVNNTRGELLVLINVYPFEQFVHLEKCTNENMQMYCRDGCRCEQQYRLHRLLAFDPNDECRGVFSDWFRFPSCCVCKCYDVPLEYRITSRSPRVLPHKYDLEDFLDSDVYEQVNRDLYEHASTDWYSYNRRNRDDEF